MEAHCCIMKMEGEGGRRREKEPIKPSIPTAFLSISSDNRAWRMVPNRINLQFNFVLLIAKSVTNKKEDSNHPASPPQLLAVSLTWSRQLQNRQNSKTYFSNEKIRLLCPSLVFLIKLLIKYRIICKMPILSDLNAQLDPKCWCNTSNYP